MALGVASDRASGAALRVTLHRASGVALGRV